MTFLSYTNSGVQAGSAQLARAKSTSVRAGGHAQMLTMRHTQTGMITLLGSSFETKAWAGLGRTRRSRAPYSGYPEYRREGVKG